MNFPVEGENVEHRVKEKPPPHVYAVAERAFSCMLRSLEERDQCKSTNFDLPPSDQSILVSGESGAGKTVTTKIIMRYLTILSQRRMNVGSGKGMEGSSQSTDRSSVETQVLQSNPVLESFGNARTIRNDNSSRFGKFIQMSFSSSNSTRGTLLGASIHFYLLEKVRLVSVNQGERNYHVFYEVLSPAMDVNEKKRYMLTSNFGRGSNPSTARDFYMTSVSGTFDRRDGVNDSDTYQELRMAMNTVGFSLDEQDDIFFVVAALLHASNLRFMLERGVDSGSEDCVVYKKDGTLAAVAKLLGVSDEAVESALTTTIIEARGERLIKRLSIEQAGKALDALSKAVYGALFAFIVNRINESIEVNRYNGDQEQVKSVATIGVLDIFGFESFDKNSFERKITLLFYVHLYIL
jgi:myosin-5